MRNLKSKLRLKMRYNLPSERRRWNYSRRWNLNMLSYGKGFISTRCASLHAKRSYSLKELTQNTFTFSPNFNEGEIVSLT